jgi:hypothetical protein
MSGDATLSICCDGCRYEDEDEREVMVSIEGRDEFHERDDAF